MFFLFVALRNELLVFVMWNYVHMYNLSKFCVKYFSCSNNYKHGGGAKRWGGI
jgi:hypothetical protein